MGWVFLEDAAAILKTTNEDGKEIGYKMPIEEFEKRFGEAIAKYNEFIKEQENKMGQLTAEIDE